MENQKNKVKKNNKVVNVVKTVLGIGALIGIGYLIGNKDARNSIAKGTKSVMTKIFPAKKVEVPTTNQQPRQQYYQKGYYNKNRQSNN